MQHKLKLDARILQRAKAKCRYYHNKEWVGYLTPSEIVALVYASIHCKGLWDVEHARDDMAKGRSNPRYFYFEPPKGMFVAEQRHACKSCEVPPADLYPVLHEIKKKLDNG